MYTLFDAFKDTLLQSDFYTEWTRDDEETLGTPFMRNIEMLRSHVMNSTSFSNVASKYVEYSRNVMTTRRDELDPETNGYYFDMANSCDSENSIFTMFAYGLVETPSYFDDYLQLIQIHDDLFYHRWILFEIEVQFMFNVVRREETIIKYIRHPIIGPTLRLDGYRSVNLEYYRSRFGYAPQQVSETITRIIDTYRQVCHKKYVTDQGPMSREIGDYALCRFSDKLKYDMKHALTILRETGVDYNYNLLDDEYSTTTVEPIDCFICGVSCTTVYTLGCKHQIHDECLKRWHSEQQQKDLDHSCPYCRTHY